ncbi:MAG: hypothetical protein ACFFDM_09085 [Candidatus Thorarchaeota archaeon]
MKEEVLAEFANTQARIVEPYSTKITTDDRNFVFIGTGGTENIVADFLSNESLREPIFLLSYDLRNSHPSAMEIRSYLQSQNVAARIIHAPLNQLVRMIGEWSEFTEMLSYLKTSTMGLVGEPSSWLIASSVDAELVKNRWGLTLKDLSLDPLIDATSSKEKHDHIKSFKNASSNCSPSDDELHKAGSVAGALREMMKNENLAAVTVQCFKLLMDTGVSGCYALNHLNNDKKLVAGCEGDVPSTFTMLLGKLLTGGPGFMANVTQVDSQTNSAVFAHCTLPTSIAESYEITTHFETGLSIGIRGTFEKQEVTVFKVFGNDLGDYWVSDGTIVENLVNDTGCRTQIRVNLEEDVSYFLERAYANHHIVFPGKHADRIRRFFDFT